MVRPMTSITIKDSTPTAISTPARAVLRHTTPMLAELDREWERLSRRPAVMCTVRAWFGDTALDDRMAAVRSLDDVLAVTQSGADADGSGNAVLRRLVELSGEHELAARIVLQRLLPGLISRSRRWTGRETMGDPTDVAIGAAWLAIRSFDIGARHRHVAPALIADALWIGFRRNARLRVETEVPVPGDVLGGRRAPERTVEPMTALAGTLRAASRAGVRAGDVELIRSLVVSGSPSQAARDRAVSVRTIRNHRDAAVRRIRRALGPEWADWSDPLVAA